MPLSSKRSRSGCDPSLIEAVKATGATRLSAGSAAFGNEVQGRRQAIQGTSRAGGFHAPASSQKEKQDGGLGAGRHHGLWECGLPSRQC